MEFDYIRAKVMETWNTYFKRFDIENEEFYPMVKLSEEVWELSEAFLIYKGKSRQEKSQWKSELELKENIAKELSDVVGVAILMADELNIDLQSAIEKKWFDRNNW